MYGGVDSCVSSELKFTIRMSSLSCFLLHFKRVTFGHLQLGKSPVRIMNVWKLKNLVFQIYEVANHCFVFFFLLLTGGTTSYFEENPVKENAKACDSNKTEKPNIYTPLKGNGFLSVLFPWYNKWLLKFIKVTVIQFCKKRGSFWAEIWMDGKEVF